MWSRKSQSVTFERRKRGNCLHTEAIRLFSFSVLLLLCLSLWEVIIELPEKRVAIGSLFRNANVSHELHLRPVSSFEEKRPPPFFFAIFGGFCYLHLVVMRYWQKDMFKHGGPMPLLLSANPLYIPLSPPLSFVKKWFLIMIPLNGGTAPGILSYYEIQLMGHREPLTM